MTEERKDKWLTVPNLLTLTRIVLVCFVLFLALAEMRFWAGLLFSLACVTDVLDGWIARLWHQESNIGAILDPIADRILVFSVLVVFAVVYKFIWLSWIVVYGGLELAWGLRALVAQYRVPELKLKVKVNNWGRARMVAGGIIILSLLFYPEPAAISMIVNGGLMPALLVMLCLAIKGYNQQIKKS